MNNSSLQIITLPSVDSTNSYILGKEELLSQNHLVVRAIGQNSGRGRLGRSWASTPGKDLTFSIVQHDLPSHTISALTIRAGFAVYRALTSIVPPGLSIKWPNDILYHENKICGILCERAENAVVIGIGVNVNSAKPDLPQHSTSLFEILSREQSVEEVMSLIIDQLIPLISEPGSLTERIIAEWTAASRSIGSKVRGTSDNGIVTGTVLSIQPDGSLLIANSDSIEIKLSGEVEFIP